jgi:hypothetical protein
MFLEATGQRLRVVAAGWTRADYEVLGRDDRLIGHAAIDELCACTPLEITTKQAAPQSHSMPGHSPSAGVPATGRPAPRQTCSHPMYRHDRRT